MNTKRKLAPRAKNGVGSSAIEKDDLLFNDENVVAQTIEGSLYSDFDETEHSSDDYEDSETDWENYDKDVTFTRKSKAVNMFKEHIIEEALSYATPELKKIYKQYGPLKIKSKDVPIEISEDEIEFK